ncbi:hypothetical protein, partial [Halomonas sp. 15WGF]|uniref:hypothetical protein n=1 Tax=Halomonas sp. 15WGF TaxID=2570357 RepID=UPI001BAEE36B
ISTVGFGNNGLAKANLHGANDQKVLAGGDRESVGAGFTDSGINKLLLMPQSDHESYQGSHHRCYPNRT